MEISKRGNLLKLKKIPRLIVKCKISYVFFFTIEKRGVISGPPFLTPTIGMSASGCELYKRGKTLVNEQLCFRRQNKESKFSPSSFFIQRRLKVVCVSARARVWVYGIIWNWFGTFFPQPVLLIVVCNYTLIFPSNGDLS